MMAGLLAAAMLCVMMKDELQPARSHGIFHSSTGLVLSFTSEIVLLVFNFAIVVAKLTERRP